MPETLPVDPAGAGASRDPEREARIEQLLLSGLDHYFAGKFEEAINLWTRVVFLERGHGRARAYIERARGAQAERQREHEELLHRGVSAYHSGDVDTARALLTRAVEEGGPTDVALTFLQRLNRLEAATDHGSATSPHGSIPPAPAREPGHTRWLPTLLASTAIATAIVLLALPIASWLAELPIDSPKTETVKPDPVPIVRTSEMLVARARALHLAGKTSDALTLLNGISASDPLRSEADQLRARVQRDALAAAGLAVDEEKGSVR
jgi:hypothetical protein